MKNGGHTHSNFIVAGAPKNSYRTFVAKWDVDAPDGEGDWIYFVTAERNWCTDGEKKTVTETELAAFSVPPQGV